MTDKAKPTARLTHHARLRCEQMGVVTRRVKRALRDPSIIYPAPTRHGDAVVVISDTDQELAVCCTPDLGVVLTVLWNGEEARIVKP